MKAYTILIGTALALTFAAGAVDLTEPITVSNVRVSQDRATQLVTVNYELANQGEPAWVTMDVLTNGVSIGMQHVNAVSGDISRYGLDMVRRGPVADDGLEKTIVWDAHRDWHGNLGSNVTVAVSTWYTNAPPGVYMVVDLSEGPAAERYPVSLTTMVPDPTDLSCVSNKLWLRYVNAGTFTQGSPETEEGRTSNRETQHQVTLTKNFYAGVFALTRAQYRLVMGSDPGNGETLTCPVNKLKFYDFVGTNINPAVSNTVVAGTFLAKIREKTGLLLNLPTDAQWEYACRAGSTNAYWFTETDTMPTAESLTSHVGSYIVTARPPNAWGLYGMVGCCHQWTTTLGRTTDNADLNASNNHNFVVFENGAVDPLGPVPSYNTPYRVVRGSHYATNDTTTQQMWDGVQRVLRFRVYRVAYRYPQKSDGSSSGGDYSLCGARLCLTLP